ncbi:MAG: hypothetical protein R3212_09830 [Xanthomonadales bacterium]|nr:hypothetical protein [Xanthomonadales bacterium]
MAVILNMASTLVLLAQASLVPDAYFLRIEPANSKTMIVRCADGRCPAVRVASGAHRFSVVQPDGSPRTDGPHDLQLILSPVEKTTGGGRVVVSPDHEGAGINAEDAQALGEVPGMIEQTQGPGQASVQVDIPRRAGPDDGAEADQWSLEVRISAGTAESAD